MNVLFLALEKYSELNLNLHYEFLFYI